MCLAKGINSGYIPLGATVVNRRIVEAWDKDDPIAPIMHGYTYSGHPLACAAALANLKIVTEEDLPKNAELVGSYFLQRIASLCEFETVGDVRGIGLMLAVEFVKNKSSKEPIAPFDPYLIGIQKSCWERGVWVRIQANKMIISPPLIFEKLHVDMAVDVIHSALSEHEYR
jgi:adenosylmethionine-8-amino-7-oxononanoate aminotransferase